MVMPSTVQTIFLHLNVRPQGGRMSFANPTSAHRDGHSFPVRFDAEQGDKSINLIQPPLSESKSENRSKELRKSANSRHRTGDNSWRALAWLVVLLSLLLSGPASAHPVPFSYLDL